MSTTKALDLDTRYLDIDLLLPNQANPRTIAPAARARLERSLQSFSLVQPIIWNKTTGQIVGGHQRVAILREQGYTHIPVVVVEWSAEKESAANLALNSSYGEFDEDKLESVLEELLAHDYDLDETALPPYMLDDVLDRPELLGESPLHSALHEHALDAVAPQTPTKDKGATERAGITATTLAPHATITQPGDIIVLGGHRLICGDCTDSRTLARLMGTERAQMVFTDPPYGYQYKSNMYLDGNPHGALANDDRMLDFLPTVLPYLDGDCALYICAGHQTQHQWRAYLDRHLTYKNTIIWAKNNWSMGDLAGAYASSYELIFFHVKGRPLLRAGRPIDVWQINRARPRYHPTTKPQELAQTALLNSSDADSLVLDVFLGSGSTLLACEATGRRARAIEIDPHYCDVAIQQWQDSTGQDAFFSDGRPFGQITLIDKSNRTRLAKQVRNEGDESDDGDESDEGDAA